MLPSVNARSTAGINQAKRDYKQSTVLTTAVQLRVTDRVARAGLITPVTGRPDRPEPCRLLLSLFHFKGEIFKNSFLYWYCKKQIFKAATKVVSYKEQFSIPASTPPEGNAPPRVTSCLVPTAQMNKSDLCQPLGLFQSQIDPPWISIVRATLLWKVWVPPALIQSKKHVQRW